jgi:hypothetical protein
LPLACELARASLAFGIYLASRALLGSSDLGKLYWSTVAAVTRPVLDWTQHFTGLPEVESASPANQHTHLILIFALFLVSWRMSMRRRVTYFGALAVLAVVQDLFAACLSLRLHEAKALFNQRGWLMLLPWEYNLLELLWYLVYAIPLQGVPFVLFLLTASWNAGLRPAQLITGQTSPTEARSPNPRTPVRARSPLFSYAVSVLAGLFLVGAASLGMGMWEKVRELDPLHLRTHVLLGNMRWLEGNVREAEGEYRHVVEAGTGEGEAWLRLAQIRALKGEREEAIGILEEAVGVVQDPTWRIRFRAEMEALGGTYP